MPQLFTFAEAPERLPSASRGLSSSAFSMLFMTGTFAWTFVEYCLHRCVFHHSPPDDSPFLITVHFLLHGQHHKVMNGPAVLATSLNAGLTHFCLAHSAIFFLAITGITFFGDNSRH